MSIEYLYFKITGGVIRAAYDRWFAIRNAQWDADQALCAEFGAKGTYGTSHFISGLVFASDAKIPEGWRQNSKEPSVWSPSGAKKEMKALKARLRNHQLVGAAEFQVEVMGHFNPFFFMDGLSMYYMVPERLGETLILCIPDVTGGDSGKWTPPDEFCIPLKKSEYWQIREEALGAA